MTCCEVRNIGKTFGRRAAALELRRYRRRGPVAATRLLLAALRAEGIEGATVLDVGAGVGAVHHELLAATKASHVVAVDASPDYLRAAAAEAARRGHADRVQYRAGDVVALAPTLPEVEVVTLDKVVCCYPDLERLLGACADRSARVLGLVYPRDRLLTRGWSLVLNTLMRVRGSGFRFVVRPAREIDAALAARGFEERINARTALWRVVVFARARGA